MSDNFRPEIISRRRLFSFLGIAAALSLAVPAVVMTATDAKAVIGRPGTPVSIAGVNRRDRRRDRRKKKK